MLVQLTKPTKSTKPTTIYDIAKKLNVSAATVSRVLSKSGYPVRADLAERIRTAAEEMQYVPNRIGRELKTKKSSTIGVIIPSITNPFYAAVVSGIEEVASEKGYQVLLCNSRQNPAMEKQHLTMLYEKKASGVILSSIDSRNEQLKTYMANGLNVVSVDQSLADFDSFQVNFDYIEGGAIGTRYLIGQGHRDIAFLTAPLTLTSRKQVCRGFLDTMEANGLVVPPERIVVASSPAIGRVSTVVMDEFECGKQLTRRLLESGTRPTALFACNDMIAFGAMNELASRGIAVPHDMSVVGFDNLAFAVIVSPTLTTIEQPKYEMGRLACEMLVEQIEKGDSLTGEMMLKPELVVRASVSAASR